MSEEGFMKFDSVKPRPLLFPKEAKKAIVEVLEYGAKKYAPDNWRKGNSPEDIERYKNALERHWDEYCLDPNSVDEESGLPHLHHVGCNVVFLIALMKGESNV